MLVPKASIDENDFASFSKYEVWLSWEILCVQPVAIAQLMRKPPDNHFRLHIFGFYGGHVLAAPLRVDFIHPALTLWEFLSGGR